MPNPPDEKEPWIMRGGNRPNAYVVVFLCSALFVFLVYKVADYFTHAK